MREHMQSRLDQLKQEHQLGESQLRELTQQEITLRETLLRISGAIQVLEECLSRDEDDGGGSAAEQRSDGDRGSSTGADAEPTVLTVP